MVGRILPTLAFLAQISSAARAADRLSVWTWFLGDVADFPATKLDWKTYTHVNAHSPHVDVNGNCTCKPDEEFRRIREYAEMSGTRLVWGAGVNIDHLLTNDTLHTNYMATIGQAARDCRVDGIEVDYEPKAGLVTRKRADAYTTFLVQLQETLGRGKEVAADLGVWGVAQGAYPVEFVPWISSHILKTNKDVVVNTMAYHTNPNCSVGPWIKDALVMDLWGIPHDQINMGIPFFSFNLSANGTIQGEPTRGNITGTCPWLAESDCVCEDVPVLSQDMALWLTKFAKEQRYRGLFAWAADFDSFGNQSLVSYIAKGLAERAPAA